MHDLVYEARDIDQRLGSPDQIDAWFEVKTKGLNDWPRDELKRQWGTMQKVLSSKSHMDRVVAKSILINLELAKKPAECLEYIVVHELAHLLEPTHNSRFSTIMDRHLPKWRFIREELNSLPVRHERWGY